MFSFLPCLKEMVISSVEKGNSCKSWGRTVTRKHGQNKRGKEVTGVASNIDECLKSGEWCSFDLKYSAPGVDSISCEYKKVSMCKYPLQ